MDNLFVGSALDQTKSVTTITLWTSAGLFSLFAVVAIFSKISVCAKSKVRIKLVFFYLTQRV